MDYFNSNFEDDQSYQEDLPEDFGWDDMKEGIYEKMGNTNSSGSRKYWSLLLLLVIGGCGWFTLGYLGTNDTSSEKMSELSAVEKKPATQARVTTLDQPVLSVEKSKVSKSESKAIVTPSNNNQNIITNSKSIASVSTSQTIVNTNREATKTKNTLDIELVDSVLKEKKSNSNSTEEGLISSAEAEKRRVVVSEDKEETEANIVAPKTAIVQEEKEALPLETPILSEAKVSETSKEEAITATESELIVKEEEAEKAAALKPQVNAFKKYLSIAITAEITNWSFGDPKNVNHDFNSGYPGYSVNPSLNWHLKENQSIQLDYSYTFFEALFEYDGSRPIGIKHNNAIVRQVVNSLTGEVISSERKDITVPGVRNSEVIKYNRYKLHALNIGYRLGKKLTTKTELDFYLGASYLMNLQQKGKRLNEDLDVFDFDDDNPVFEKSQLGLRLGIGYNFWMLKNTQLFSRIMATQYITNWELSTSKSGTRPFVYGFQIGLRQRFKK